MSRQYVDTTGPTVGGPSCSYATLSHYNNGSKGMQPPRPAGTATGYVVPAYGAPGYGTLQHGPATCSGYPDIGDAYKGGGGSCNQKYVRKLCQ